MSAFDEWMRGLSTKELGASDMLDHQLCRRAAEAAWNAALSKLEGPSGVGAIPETNDYANGWNDCRQRMFAEYKARIKELRT